MKNLDEQIKIIMKGVDEIVSEEDLKEKLQKSINDNRPLKIKLGLDPSAADIHLGHAVVLRKLKQIQDLGHEVTIIIGDFTGMIGDPTGKSKARKQLSREEVEQNAKTYTDQMFKILDKNKTKVLFNSTWLEKLNFKDVIELSSKYTLARMLEREDFKNRFINEKPLSLHEFFYPLMQGYDSVQLKCDIEMGGRDQRFNVLMGRHLQKEYGIEPQIALFMPLLEGTDGKEKMSKSLNNYVGISEKSEVMFTKVMRVPDDLIIKYFNLCTDISKDEVDAIEEKLKNGANPRDIKLDLAFEITKLYNGEDGATKGKEYFNNVIQNGNIPENIEEVLLEEDDLLGILIKGNVTKSRGEGRRLLLGGAIKINGDKIQEIVDLKDGDIVSVGKNTFLKVKI